MGSMMGGMGGMMGGMGGGGMSGGGGWGGMSGGGMSGGGGWGGMSGGRGGKGGKGKGGKGGKSDCVVQSGVFGGLFCLEGRATLLMWDDKGVGLLVCCRCTHSLARSHTQPRLPLLPL